MDIKAKIKALLQTKFGGMQLSQSRVDALSERLEGKVTSEEALEEKLTAIDEITPFAEMRSEDDRARSLQAELDKLKKPETDPEPKPEPAPNETPEWAKALIEGNKTLADKLAILEGNKVVTDRRSAILAKLKDADEAYSSKVIRDFGRMSFQDDAAFEEYLGEVEADFATHIQAQAESKLGADVPFKSVGKDGKVNEASQAEIEELFGEITI